MRVNLPKLAVSLTLPLLTGFLGSYFTATNIPVWYANLQKPIFSPPNWVFGPVWTVLYLLMGYSFYLIWQEKKSKAKTSAVYFYLLQLGLNLIWSYLFFSLRLPPIALVEIIILWLAIFITFLRFIKLNQTAGLLFIPYLLWVSFATYLNYQIVVLNPF